MTERWQVTLHSRDGEIVLGQLNSWWAASRLVFGISGYEVPVATTFDKEFSTPWYKDVLEVRKVG